MLIATHTVASCRVVIIRIASRAIVSGDGSHGVSTDKHVIRQPDLVVALKALLDDFLAQVTRLTIGFPVVLQHNAGDLLRHHANLKVAVGQAVNDVHHHASTVHGFFSGLLVAEEPSHNTVKLKVYKGRAHLLMKAVQ